MATPDVYIVTGEKQSGKTTRLLNAIQNRDDVYGMLTPDVDGKRFFMNVRTKELWPMEAAEAEANVLTIGKYRFSKAAFQKAISVLEAEANQQNGWLIVDELGPLELKKSGFYNTVRDLLNTNTPLKIILVIRQSLLGEMTELFGISNYAVVDNALPE